MVNIAKSLLVIVLSLWPWSVVQAQSGIGRQGRWFTYNGQPEFLVGFDCQELAADPTIDFIAALNWFSTYRINKVRIFTYVWFGTTSFGALTPWATDGSGRHDLDRWNDAYWSRLNGFVRAAEERGIAVEVTIFAPYPAADWWWSSDEFRVAWNRAYNVNGAFSSNANGHFQPEFFDLAYDETSSSGKRLVDYQRALVDKVVAEVGGYPNVYFEICNEFGTYSLDVNRWYGWQTHWAERIDGRSARPVAVHAGGGNEPSFPQLYWSEPAVDVLNFRFRFGVTPTEISAALHSVQTRGKIMAVNESHSSASGGAGATDFYGNLDAETQYAWGLFMSGAHVGFYEDDSSRVGSPGWRAGAERLRALREVVERTSFWELSPVDATGGEYDNLVTQGPGTGGWQVMANPGREYLVFFWGEPTGVETRIDLPAGDYDYFWYEPRDASVLASGKIAGGSQTSISVPSSSWNSTTGVILHIRSIACVPICQTACGGEADGCGGTCPVNDGAACPDDGEVCTGDVCAGGSCTHPPIPGCGEGDGGTDGGLDGGGDGGDDGLDGSDGGDEGESPDGGSHDGEGADAGFGDVGDGGEDTGDDAGELTVVGSGCSCSASGGGGFILAGLALVEVIRRMRKRGLVMFLALVFVFLPVANPAQAAPCQPWQLPDANGYCSAYEVNIGPVPPCDVVIRPSDPDWSAIEGQPSARVFCLECGDHYAKGRMWITSSGTAGAPRWLRYTCSDDNGTHPVNQQPAKRARLKAIVFGQASHWVLHRLTFDAQGDNINSAISFGGWGEPDGGNSHIVLDRLLLQDAVAHFIQVRSGNADITLQNSVVRNSIANPYFEAQCIEVGEGPRFHVINNEIYNCQKGVSNGNGPYSHPGLIVDNNDIYATADIYSDCSGNYNGIGPCAATEDLISIKAGGEALDPILIVHNRLWGARTGDPNLGLALDGDGTAMSVGMSGNPDAPEIVGHQGGDWLSFRDNVVWDCGMGLGAGFPRNEHISVVGNIFWDMAESSRDPDAPATWNTYGGFDTTEFYLNTIVEGDNWMQVSWSPSVDDVRCNTIIDALPLNSLAELGSGTVLDNNVFYGTRADTTENAATNLHFALRPWSPAATVGVGDLIKDSTNGNILVCTKAGTTGAAVPPAASPGANISDGTVTWKVIRGPYCFYRKLRTAPERVCIPYAVPDVSAPEYGFCRGIGLGSRSGIGIDDEVAPW